MRDVDFSALCGFFDKQWEATTAADAHRFTLFGGSRGPGKSYWLRWWLMRFLALLGGAGLRGVRVMLACEDYPSLYERQIVKIEAEFPRWLGQYWPGKKEFVLEDCYGGGTVALRNLDDPERYQSAEFAAIGIDELTRNPERTFDILRGSLRWPGVEEPRMVAATNPTGPFAAWVRRYWIEHDLPDGLKPLAGQFAFVPGLPDDNPYLPASYIEELESLPEPLRSAWLKGDWFAAVEGLVYANFGAANVVDREPDPERPIELAFDDGYVDPRAILFIQRTGAEILVFDEIYESKRLAQESVDRVVERCVAEGWPLPELAVGSVEANELHMHFRRADIPVRVKGQTVVPGIQLVRRLICDGKGYRAIKVHSRCRNMLREITEGYQYATGGRRAPDEKPMDGNDHAVDALRYWCQMRARL